MQNCPECGALSPEHDTRDVSYTYNGKQAIIPAVSGHFCANCGEVTLDSDAVDRYAELACTFQRQVNGASAAGVPNS